MCVKSNRNKQGMEQFIDPVEQSENVWSSHLLKLWKSGKVNALMGNKLRCSCTLCYLGFYKEKIQDIVESFNWLIYQAEKCSFWKI